MNLEVAAEKSDLFNEVSATGVTASNAFAPCEENDRDRALLRAESLITEVADYPIPGILFRDITPLLANAEALRLTVDALIAPFRGHFDVVAGVEARGFLLASAVAVLSGAGLVPVRKAGKLPRPAAAQEFTLEYGTATLEMHDDLAPGTRVLLIDDVLATGGTLAASQRLITDLGYVLAGTAVLFEIDGLGGRSRLQSPALHTVFHNDHSVNEHLASVS